MWITSTVLLGSLLATAGSVGRSGSQTRRPQAAPATPDETQVRELDIAFYQARAAAEPRGALDLAQLAVLYLQRARETGSNEDLIRAEETARRSLGNRVSHNTSALQVLASSLMAQHRFAEALTEAERLVGTDPENGSLRSLIAEIQLELGRYQEARASFKGLLTDDRNPAVAPRLARWAELQGHPEEARRILLVARDAVSRLHSVPREQLAWFDLRVGDLALRHGHLKEAEKAFKEGLAVFPGDHRLLASMARLEAARQRWRSTIEYGDQAISLALDPATLGLVGDAYAALGDSAKAEEHFRAMEVSVSQQPGAYHRAWSLFLLDHGRRLPEVLEKMRAELNTRRDIYGYDLLAWALYRNGRASEARVAIDSALRLGTRDAVLRYHAGMIERALNQSAAARRSLEAALEINPRFDPTQALVARRALDELKTAVPSE